MKSCYTFLLLMLLSLAGTAQTTIFDFEGDAPAFGDFGASTTTVVDNPDSQEPNTSANVAQNIIGSGGSFAGVIIPQTVDLADGTKFTMQVWSPLPNTPVLLKFEDGTPSVERSAIASGPAMAWQTVTFNFTGAEIRSWPNVTVFMNFNVVDGMERTYFWDNLVQLVDDGSVVGPDMAAPTPTRAAEDVLSVYSDAYDDVTIATYRADFGSSTLTDTTIEDNATLYYSNLDFAGIETGPEDGLDLVEAGMTHIHFSYWSANSSAFKVKLVDFGGDGFEGDNPDTEFEVTRNPAQNQWVSIEIPLVAFQGVALTDVAQIIIVGEPFGQSNVYLDNIYFYESDEPVLAQIDLPVTFEEDDVDYGLVDFEGASSMLIEDPVVAGNTVAETTKGVGAATFAGTTVTSEGDNLPGFATRIPLTAESSIITVDVWAPAAGIPVRVKIEDANDPTVSVETQVNTTIGMSWHTLSFDFKNQAEGTAAVNFASFYNKLTIFFDFGTVPTEARTYYWDNVKMSGTTGGGGGDDDVPMVAAPTPPARDAANVISLFSDAYTDINVDTWRTDWSQGSQFSDVMVDGNATKKYTEVQFFGITVEQNPIDLVAANMTTLHIDYWTPDMTEFFIKMVDFGGTGFDPENDNTEVERQFTPVLKAWNSLDIPLDSFDGMNLNDINQFVLGGQPSGGGTLYIDNFYFFNNSVSTTGTPVTGLLEAYPNPVNDRMLLSAPARMESVTVYSIGGQVVGRFKPNADQMELDMSSYAPGMYVAMVVADGRAMTIKVMKD